MPVAIAKLPGQSRAVVFGPQAADKLLEALRMLPGAPEMHDQFAATEWLQTLPEPSGWFPTAYMAAEHVVEIGRKRLQDVNYQVAQLD